MKAKEGTLLETPETFSKYVEGVRQMTEGISERISATMKPFELGNTKHFVFQLDVAQLGKIVSEHKKFECGKFLHS